MVLGGVKTKKSLLAKEGFISVREIGMGESLEESQPLGEAE